MRATRNTCLNHSRPPNSVLQIDNIESRPSDCPTSDECEVEVEVDTLIDRTRPGDVYLLCSDGLSGVIEHGELTAILLEHRDLCRTVGHLVERANELGGPDNITAVVVRVSDSAR